MTTKPAQSIDIISFTIRNSDIQIYLLAGSLTQCNILFMLPKQKRTRQLQ